MRIDLEFAAPARKSLILQRARSFVPKQARVGFRLTPDDESRIGARIVGSEVPEVKMLGGEGRNRPQNAAFRSQIGPIGRTDQLNSAPLGLSNLISVGVRFGVRSKR